MNHPDKVTQSANHTIQMPLFNNASRKTTHPAVVQSRLTGVNAAQRINRLAGKHSAHSFVLQMQYKL